MYNVNGKFNIAINASSEPTKEFAAGASLRYPTAKGQSLPFLRNAPVYQLLGDYKDGAHDIKIPVSDGKRDTDIVTKSFGDKCALIVDAALGLFEAERSVKNAKTSAQRVRAAAQADKLREAATSTAAHFPLSVIFRTGGKVYVSGKGWEGKHTTNLGVMLDNNVIAAALIRDHAVQAISEERVRDEIVKQLRQLTLIDVEGFYDEYASIGSQHHALLNADAMIAASALFNVVRDLRAGEYGLSEYMLDYVTDVATLQQRIGDTAQIIHTASIPIHFHEIVNALAGADVTFDEGIFLVRMLSDYWRGDATVSADGPKTVGDALFFPDVIIKSSDERQIIFQLPSGVAVYRVEHHGALEVERVKKAITAFIAGYASAFKAMWSQAPAILFKQLGISGVVVSPVIRL